MFPSVPSYRLPAVHRLLEEKGIYQGVCDDNFV